MSTHRGVTLVELIVVLVLLSILASVVVLSVRATPPARPFDHSIERVVAARDSALRTGHPVSLELPIKGVAHVATAFPDGRVEADSVLQFDQLSGRSAYANH